MITYQIRSSIQVLIFALFGCLNPTANTGKSVTDTLAVSTVSDNELPSNFKIINTRSDSTIFISIVEKFHSEGENKTDMNKLVISIAKEFLGTPYLASTLEVDGDEKLVINLREMDCTTFVEYVLALTQSIKKDNPSFGDFARYLTTIRYREGILDGYPSRLHYFTEWMVDNAAKGLVDIVSNEIGNAAMPDSIYIMSSNPESYRQLSNPLYLKQISEIERQVSGYNLKYLTKDRIDANAHLIKDGDIIAFKTAIKGLDVSHTGFAVHVNGRLHLLHASLNRKEVEITEKPIQEHLAVIRNVQGILVARPLLTDHP
jgi:hypothetical protein